MLELKVEVKYNSYLNDNEVGDLSCDTFDSFVDFCEHVATCRKTVEAQMRTDPQYFDVLEARIDAWVRGERMGTVHFRRDSREWSKVIVSSNQKQLV